jgi:hypothetical protein
LMSVFPLFQVILPHSRIPFITILKANVNGSTHILLTLPQIFILFNSYWDDAPPSKSSSSPTRRKHPAHAISTHNSSHSVTTTESHSPLLGKHATSNLREHASLQQRKHTFPTNGDHTITNWSEQALPISNENAPAHVAQPTNVFNPPNPAPSRQYVNLHALHCSPEVIAYKLDHGIQADVILL